MNNEQVMTEFRAAFTSRIPVLRCACGAKLLTERDARKHMRVCPRRPTWPNGRKRR